MTLDAWLNENEITTSEFARRIDVEPSTVHKYRYHGRVPDSQTMPLVVRETGGAVQPNDFFGIAPTSKRRRKTA